jgi:hypothetical protein
LDEEVLVEGVAGLAGVEAAVDRRVPVVFAMVILLHGIHRLTDAS